MKPRKRELAVLVFILLALVISDATLHAQTNPVPFINQPLVPTAAAPGGPGFTLTVNGTGFVSGAVVNWNGNARTTNFVSTSRLTATISASDIANVGTTSITVQNPGPSGRVSNIAFLGISPSIPLPTFTTLIIGSGISGVSSVVAADLDNDGKLDLIGVTNGGFGNLVVVLLGNGDGSFQRPVTYQVGRGSGSGVIATGDFNRDGKLDVAVANTFDNTVSILLGDGHGTFQPQTTLATLSFPNSIVAADFNRDGKLDLVMDSSGGGSAGSTSVLLGNGDGTFQQHKDFSTGATTILSMTMGDFNGDGNLDLVFPEANAGTLWILLGNGDGTFQVPKNGGPIPRLVRSMTTADLNGDGKLDLILVSTDAEIGHASVLLGNGDGTFRSPVGYEVGYTPVGGAVGDFNADGNLDLIIFNSSLVFPSSFGDLAILLGNGNGTFQMTSSMSSLSSGSTQPSGVVAGDFNNDGKMDVVVPLAGGAGNNSIGLLLQGAFPVVSLPGGVQFSSQSIGSSSSSQITLTNSGTATLTASSIVITGTNSTDFAQANNCGGSLSAGLNCVITVTFRPTATGPRSGSLTIADNAVGGKQTVTLNGTGLGPIASISPAGIIFPSQFVGTTGLPQTVTLTNTGSAVLNITSVTTSPADFGQLSACSSSLAAGSSCAIGVFFDPTVGGARNGTLTIADNASDSPQTVALSGAGEDFMLAPSSAATATVSRGQTASYSLTVAPNGGFNQSVAFTCSGAPSQSTCAVSPSSIALNGSAAATANVTVTTTAASLIVREPRGNSPSAKGGYRPLHLIAGLLGLSLLAGLLSWRRDRRPRLAYGRAFMLFLCVGAMMSACGGGSSGGSGGNPGTPTGTYTLVVSGTFTSGSTTVTRNSNLTLVVQ